MVTIDMQYTRKADMNPIPKGDQLSVLQGVISASKHEMLNCLRVYIINNYGINTKYSRHRHAFDLSTECGKRFILEIDNDMDVSGMRLNYPTVASVPDLEYPEAVRRSRFGSLMLSFRDAEILGAGAVANCTFGRMNGRGLYVYIKRAGIHFDTLQGNMSSYVINHPVYPSRHDVVVNERQMSLLYSGEGNTIRNIIRKARTQSQSL